ncbi:MAG: hypothetical protein ACRD45_00260 [Bryobacteraceae bacterium]
MYRFAGWKSSNDSTALMPPLVCTKSCFWTVRSRAAAALCSAVRKGIRRPSRAMLKIWSYRR